MLKSASKRAVVDLKLVLKYKWFDMIDSGVKKEEYREIKKSMVSKLFDWRDSGLSLYEFTQKIKNDGNETSLWIYLKRNLGDVIFFRGYTNNKSTFEFGEINIGKAKPQWSDDWQGDCFVISIGDKIN